MGIGKMAYSFCCKKDMQYIQRHDRNQTYFITLDDQLAIDNPVRLIDAFVDKLDLEKLGFTGTVTKSEGHRRIGAGRPPYAPQVLLKWYLYGYLNKTCSSRNLEKESRRNIELQWLLCVTNY
jgi:transposase